MEQNYTNATLYHIPLVALRGIMIFPDTSLHFDVSREISKKAIQKAMEDDSVIALSMQITADTEHPAASDIHPYATLCKIKQILDLPGNAIRVIVQGLTRIKIMHFNNDFGYFEVDAVTLEEKDESPVIAISLRNLLHKAVEQYTAIAPVPSTDKIGLDDRNLVKFTDTIANHYVIDVNERQKLLELSPLYRRMEYLYELMMTQIDIATLEQRIQNRVKEQVEKSQRDFYLNEQIKSIQVELGNTNAQEVEQMRQKLEATPMNEEAKEKVKHEIDRYAQMPNGSPEVVVSRTYIEYILDLPWGIFTEDELDIAHAKEVLDKRHYGLDKVKERIIEFIAVLNKKKNMRGPILCFVGPPGVGKTSIVRAIAEALGRNFVQMSLGGVRDEAEIRGHRRTYVSAIPGRIIAGIKQSGSMNPLFLFDEIDKMASDFRGDPASAMLEVLDAEQNDAFRDHYLELPFDLSNVMFVTTANSMDTIPAPLLDRLEIIEVSSYTMEEKLQIAKKHLFPKQLLEHGMPLSSIKISDAILQKVIQEYTRESGVRSLERCISKLIRKSVVEMTEHQKKTLTISEQRMYQYLGTKRYPQESLEKKPQVGIVNGLAYTPFGGVVLTVECIALPGNGKIHLTGKLGEVMKESADAALSWVRAHADEYKLDKDFFKNTDIHIHVPEGAVPKDGPSAGVTITCAILSALSNRKVRQDISMTGEITLRGNVLAIGGVKEKLFAAYRNNLKNIFLPEENIKDLEELPKQIVEKLNIKPVKTVKEILDDIFV